MSVRPSIARYFLSVVPLNTIVACMYSLKCTYEPYCPSVGSLIGRFVVGSIGRFGWLVKWLNGRSVVWLVGLS